MTTHAPPTLTLSGAQTALAAARAQATSLSVPMNIAIVDASCHLLAFARMDAAKTTSIDIALNKAFTAAGHRIPTGAYGKKVHPGEEGIAFGIQWSNGGRFCTIAGGVPVVLGGRVVGAVGCSSGTPGEDEQVAEAGVRAVVEAWEAENRGSQVKAKL